MRGKAWSYLVFAGAAMLILEAWWFSVPRSVGTLRGLFSYYVALPTLGICAFASILLLLRRARSGWVTLGITLFLVPFLWPWPLLANLMLHESALISYIRSGTDQPARIGPFQFLRADAHSGAITAEYVSGAEGLWLEEGATRVDYGFFPMRLNSRWVFAAEE